jgi:hypothetical protein
MNMVETALQELSEVYDGTMNQVSVCKKLLSMEQENVPSVMSLENVAPTFESLDAADFKVCFGRIENLRRVVSFIDAQ